ncbi:hypothetical protein PC116_g1354 [Phytophthora cactorum]|uniref:Uncharacterized protein n=1 Tax=Phytophthora cactorum TaxID=29920 RepID=A0A8T1DW84_9STRA|nr:hypothetical protein Pcac1_g10201 [Phytophthora cactorum]KAG3112772.1 hypothetical protein PI125_g7901 [Phytophthora idaei]KAG2840198.1 hypothetical protein PC111_g3586 [Phytophthora cactorum]KAG2868847.1 hypothetical protein PC113_g715 [Phytophthora cactorum]KAG2928618.1 hypothetical protein PC114_g3075 [Phytophthora cactorum]
MPQSMGLQQQDISAGGADIDADDKPLAAVRT